METRGQARKKLLNDGSASSRRNTNGSHNLDSNCFNASAVSNGTSSTALVSAVKFQESFFVRSLTTLCLLMVMPNFIMWIWYAVKYHDGSYTDMVISAANSSNKLDFLLNVWIRAGIGSTFSLCIIGGYMILQLLLMRTVPGRKVYGPVTPKGHVPEYTDNGFHIYCMTMAAFAALTWYLKVYTSYSPSLVYDNFGNLLATMNLFSIIFCLLLYIKGVYWPSNDDCGTSGNPIFDYYWGTELYPRILGWDIKVFTNCRFGCTVWALLPCCFAVKSYELYGFENSINMFVSLAILLVYLTKFFWWEAGYMCTIDIILDRAGYYICWGCLCFIPGLYTAFSLYLVSHPIAMGYPLATGNLLAGIGCIALNYMADWEKQRVRETNGWCTVWGKKPDIIRAKYRTSQGEERTSILLASGCWGLARHFHYLPEIGLACFWTIPAGFSHILPYSYLIFLIMLLVHRTYRDDIKCGQKYGEYWKEYKQRVPYRIIPYVY